MHRNGEEVERCLSTRLRVCVSDIRHRPRQLASGIETYKNATSVFVLTYYLLSSAQSFEKVPPGYQGFGLEPSFQYSVLGMRCMRFGINTFDCHKRFTTLSRFGPP